MPDYPDQTSVMSAEQMLEQGDRVVFRGAPNVGVPQGPAHSPEYGAALNQ